MARKIGPGRRDSSSMDRSVSIIKMTNAECRMTKETPMTNDEKAGARLFVLRASSLIRHSSLSCVISLSSPHARHIWNAYDPAQNFLAWYILYLSDTNGIS